MTQTQQVIVIAEILKKRFPNLTTMETVKLAGTLVEAINND